MVMSRPLTSPGRPSLRVSGDTSVDEDLASCAERDRQDSLGPVVQHCPLHVEVGRDEAVSLGIESGTLALPLPGARDLGGTELARAGRASGRTRSPFSAKARLEALRLG
jgi:hypothetical protein